MMDSIPFLDLNAMTADVRHQVDTAWQNLLHDGDFVRGSAVAQFELEWAQFCGTRHAVGVANGTDALCLTLRALDIGPGDEVVVPTNTFVATAEAVVLVGATPRFADVDPDTLLLSAESLAAALTPSTRAVIVVHLFGQMPNMDDICDVARRANIMVIEDAAQAHGATWRGRRAGAFGAAGCFSFYPGKNLGAYGDAGAIVTSDDILAARLRSLGDHGRPPGGHNEHVAIGTNSRLDTLQAAVLSAKLGHLPDWNRARRALVSRYRKLLDGTPARMVDNIPGSHAVYHLAVVQVPDREFVRNSLAAQGIATGVHYTTPCHLLKPYLGSGQEPLPVAEAAAGRILSLPLFPHMTIPQVDRVADVLLCAVSTRAGKAYA